MARSKDASRRAEYEAELACPPLPMALLYLWSAFLRLSNRRGAGGFGVNPISYGEIEAFCRLSGQRFAPWEIRLIEELDQMFMVEQSKARE